MHLFNRFALMVARALCVIWPLAIIPMIGLELGIGSLGSFASGHFVACNILAMNDAQFEIYIAAIIIALPLIVYTMIFVEGSDRKESRDRLMYEFAVWLRIRGMNFPYSRDKFFTVYREFLSEKYPDQSWKLRLTKTIGITFGICIVCTIGFLINALIELRHELNLSVVACLILGLLIFFVMFAVFYLMILPLVKKQKQY